MAGWEIETYPLNGREPVPVFQMQDTETIVPSGSFNLNVKGVILELK